MTGPSAKPSKVRFLILALVTGGTMINYLDRTLLSVAAPSVTKELGLDAAVMGLVFSVFSWTYAAAQIPGGVFLDRFGALWQRASKVSGRIIGSNYQYCGNQLSDERFDRGKYGKP